ncbi:MAG: hypothetical protein AB8G17_10795 [Gammaproteobacteria bacterium]
MNRAFTTGAAVVVAALAGYLFATLRQSDAPTTGVRPAIAIPAEAATALQPPEPIISAEQAKDHRATHYEQMASVDDVLELPTDFAQTEALYVLAGRADAGELEQLIFQSASIAHRYDRRAALEILFTRYAEIDPDAALAFLLQIDLDIDDIILPSLFSAWSKSDPAGAIAAANEIDNARLRKLAGRTILSIAARNDPGTLKTIGAQLVDRHDTHWIEAEMIGNQANYQPVLALEQALAVSRHVGGRDAVWRVAFVWARNDPDAALAYADNIQDRGRRQHFIDAVASRWMDEDPEAALQAVLALPDGAARSRTLSNALGGYAKTYPAQAVRVAQSLGDAVGGRALQTVYTTWAQNDPDGALRALGEGEANDEILTSVMMVVSTIDAEKAWQFAQTLSDVRRAKTLPSVLSQMSSTDPQRALDLAMAIDRPQERARILQTVLGQIANTDPQIATRYLDQIPPSDVSPHLFGRLAQNHARSDPTGAMAWASTLSGEAYTKAIQGIGQTLAYTDPDLAASMMDQVSADERGQWIQSISDAYAQNNPQRALAFVKQHQDEPGYYQSLNQVLLQLARTDPRGALREASSLGDDQRAMATSMALSTWSNREPRAAARWAQSSDELVRAQALSSVASNWAGLDSASAERWAMSLRGDDRDRALSGLINSSALSKPTDQVRMINTLGSQALRDQAALSTYARVLNRFGRQEADATLDQLDISDAVRERTRASGF